MHVTEFLTNPAVWVHDAFTDSKHSFVAELQKVFAPQVAFPHVQPVVEFDDPSVLSQVNNFLPSKF